MSSPANQNKHIPKLPALHLAGIGIALVCILILNGLFSAWFTGLDQRLGDAFWRMSASAIPEERIVIVDIDEASINELGPWPWPRARISQLSERLAASGVGMQIFDIVFNAEQADDIKTSSILQQNHALHAQLLALDQGAPTRSGKLPQLKGMPACQNPLPEAHGYIASAPAFAEIPSGHITPRVNADGIVRQQPAYICSEGNAYPALGLAAYLQGAGNTTAPQLKPGKHWLDAAWQLTIPATGQVLPLDEHGNLHIPYSIAPEAMQAVSAADILAGRTPAGLLEGRWALISSTAFGLGDVVSTPHGGAQGGVSVHLQLLAGLLDDRMPYPPKGQAQIQFIATSASILLLLALVALAHWRRWPGYGLPFAGLILAGLLIAGQAWAQVTQGWLIGMSLPALAVMLSGSLLGLAELIQTGGERSRLLIYLTSYLPSPVAEKLLARAPQSEIVAERREVAVLYADIRNFSAYCEAYEPERAAGVLHRFLSTTSQIVEAHGGLIESVNGDAILAVWNGSQPCTDPASKALRAAMEMETRIAAELPHSADDSTELPPPLALGIGLEYGQALIGSFGPRHRRVHTALGKTISIAVRLQGLTADLSWPILVGPGLTEQLQKHTKPADAELLPQGEFLLEGLTQSCVVQAVKRVAL